MAKERLHKFLARAGVASRRQAEEMIRRGLIRVNGEKSKIGDSIDPKQDKVFYAGRPVMVRTAIIYAFNKPVGVTSTLRDPHADKTIGDFFPKDRRVYPVGRLDKYSGGLILVTNDGELANLLMHPRYNHEKEYAVELRGENDSNLQKFTGRYELDELKTQPMQLKSIQRLATKRWRIHLILKEGKKRQIRRIAQMLGYQVERLTRLRVGKLRLDDLKAGKWRIVKREDII
ncbi:hypothetical protein A3K24_02560 [candidate division Kazan bacterium RIFCSPHIGHO2_01_FULL_44_14]|uniref:Pseudouridine synthase n=1 Tax=candidate division Kazan bacterium RIFCSPLOWO2_01_FULL_45_19 TaxID=1798538 RepID=A0A1F4NQQ7_UNCK3|nr:hypothetical protein [uncultured bacterium]AQS31120.1 hypothetical protein [uncultured bacterium]OGB73696.1 MAG: hypothetical protein A3K51_02560 [candidate division Kazan bacterium RIFCSPLOWO2_01_FULL_45_19]OGB77941.1 MAG: hypothetical protein A3K24_02560 [candidate division Kazan bacterium RIFCSPHIGHO2_01_FULL_44_14]